MTDNHPALQYAQYKLKDKAGVSLDLFVGNDAYIASANKPLPKVSLKKDYELLAQYGEWHRQKLESEASRQLHSLEPSTSTSTNPTPVLPQTASSSTSIPPPLVGGLRRSHTAEDQMTSQELVVNEMMQETKESKDVCIFYLESTNWDLQAAIELLRSMQVR